MNSSNKKYPHYDLIDIKGQGRYGYVLEAYDQDKDIRVAIKRTQILGTKYARELEVLESLQGSEYIVKLYDAIFTIGEDKTIIINYIFEYVPKNLFDYMKEFYDKKTHIPIEKIKLISKQLLLGLDYCHKRGIVHRDIKPDNILLTKNEQVRICDFGLAKSFIKKNKKDGKEEIKLSTPICCARCYRAPELFLGKTDYNSKVDIFSAGCVICQMFIFQPLFIPKHEGAQIFEYMNILGVPEKEYFQKFNMPKNFWELFEKLKGLKLYEIEEILNKDRFYKDEDIKIVKDLIFHMLDWDPDKRFSAADCLQHAFFCPKEK